MKELLTLLKKENIQLMLFSLCLQLIGYTFLIIYFGWLLSAIVFVIQWGNNIEMSNNTKRK